MNDHVDDSEMLVALMRTAATAQDAPPAAFGHAEVVATSHRITRRRRMVAAGAAGLVLIAGLGTAAVLPIMNRNGGSSTVAEAPRTPTTAPAGAPAEEGATPFVAGPTGTVPPGPRAPDQVLPVPGQAAPTSPPAASQEQAPDTQDRAPAPKEPPASTPGGGGGTPPRNQAKPRDEPAKPVPGPAESGGSGGGAGYNGPGLGPSSGDCGKQQDPDLRSVVVDALPQGVDASNASTTQSFRPAGERAVHLEVKDSDKTGLLTVVYTPKDGASPGGDESATTASGGRVGVSLRSTGDGPAPFDVGGLAARLAPRL